MGWGTVCYLPWVWLQIDGPLMESQAGNLDHCAVPAEREREGEGAGGREGGLGGQWGGEAVCYLPWLWLQIDGLPIGRKPSALCSCDVERDGEWEGGPCSEGGREGGW